MEFYVGYKCIQSHQTLKRIIINPPVPTQSNFPKQSKTSHFRNERTLLNTRHFKHRTAVKNVTEVYSKLYLRHATSYRLYWHVLSTRNIEIINQILNFAAISFRSFHTRPLVSNVSLENIMMSQLLNRAQLCSN
jgi:hypothetical protein